MPKIRARPDLTEARDEVVARLEALLGPLREAATLKDLHALLYSLKALRADESIADLVVAVEAAEGGKGARTEDDTAGNNEPLGRSGAVARRRTRAKRPAMAHVERSGVEGEGLSCPLVSVGS